MSYQWCAGVTPGTTHTVKIKMAASSNKAFMEGESFYIDTSSMASGCNLGTQ